jgi:hypothetical protein
VALVRTDVSEELSAFFIRITRIGELRTTLAVNSNIAEDDILYSLRRENLYPYKDVILILGFRCSDYEECRLLRCDTV